MVEESAEDLEVDEDGDDGARLAITTGDITIFKLICEFRFLRREHLSRLTGRPAKRLHRRLHKLVSAGYLASIRLPQQKHIYSLGRAASHVLVEEGIADDNLLAERLRVHELKELFLRHEMMIVDIHVLLSLAGNKGALRPIAWREGRELFDSVMVADHDGLTKLPIRPDVFFTLEDSRRPAGANRAHFFLEADRSTATQTRFKDKIRAYWHYLEQGLHTKKFDIKNFRMVTVTLTHERAKNLCDLAASVLPERARKYYLFASLKNFSLDNPEPILGNIYLSPRSPGDVYHPLVVPPTISQSEHVVL
jgi:hypothetical protein